jgi:peptidoglycan/LPS O-acetylase OafA/YrhL
LSCEAFFYAAFPFVVRPLAEARNPARVAIAIVLAMIFASIVLHFSLPREVTAQIVYKNPLFRFGEFAIGILLASNVEKLSRFNNIPIAVAGFAVCAGGVGIFVWIMTKVRIPMDRDFADIVMLPATAFLIVSTANSDLAGRASLFRSPALVLLGRASFALYMVHSLLLQVTAAAFGKSYVAWVLATLVSVLLSLLTFKLIEEPVETWLRARIGNPRPSLVPA